MTEETTEEVEEFVFPEKEAQIGHYELTVLVTNLTDEVAAEVMATTKKTVESFGGELTHEENMGRRTLAYTIDNTTSGNYFLMEFDMDRSKIADLNEKLRITKEISRYLIVKRPKRTPEEIVREAKQREDRLSKARKARPEEKKPARKPAPRKPRSEEGEVTKPAKPSAPAQEAVKPAATAAPAAEEVKKNEDKKPLADIDSEIEKLLSDEVDV